MNKMQRMFLKKDSDAYSIEHDFMSGEVNACLMDWEYLDLNENLNFVKLSKSK